MFLAVIVGLRFLWLWWQAEGDQVGAMKEPPRPPLRPLTSSPGGPSFFPSQINPPADAEAEATAPRTFELPIELVLRPFESLRHSPELQPLLEHLSNVSQAVNHILSSGKYRIHRFGRSTLFLSRDESQTTDWQLLPNPTNLTIVAVTAKVYRDPTFTELDPGRSFMMQCDLANGHLRSFEWTDVHEAIDVMTNGVVVYNLTLSNQVCRQLQWDASGELVSSNVYDWAKRGRIISRPSAR
jgi:hypothetical protein